MADYGDLVTVPMERLSELIAERLGEIKRQTPDHPPLALSVGEWVGLVLEQGMVEARPELGEEPHLGIRDDLVVTWTRTGDELPLVVRRDMPCDVAFYITPAWQAGLEDWGG